MTKQEFEKNILNKSKFSTLEYLSRSKVDKQIYLTNKKLCFVEDEIIYVDINGKIWK